MHPKGLWTSVKACSGHASRRVRRIALVFVVAPLLVLLTSGPAAADGGSNSPSSLSWIKIKDSHDTSIWNYEMSLDRGGVTNPGKVIWSFITDIMWGLYLSAMGFAIWIIDWALGFTWLDLVTSPLMRIGDALTVVVAQLGVVPTLLTITAITSVLWMARGKWVLGIFELFMSLFIASLAIGALSNPVGLVADKDGLLYQTRDFGLAMSTGLANDGDTSGSPDEIREDVTGMLADTFVRQPAQIVNFGAVLDGGKCEDEYTDAVKDGPYGTDDDIRDAVAACDADYGQVAENPNSGMAMSAITLFPSALIVVLFAIVLSGVVIVSGLYALYQSVKLIVTLLAGMLPGASRGSLWMTLADLVISLVTLVFSVIFLGAYLLVIQAIFASGTPENRLQTFFIVDVMLIVGTIVFWKGRQRLKDATERVAQALAKRPGMGPTALPQRNKFNPADAYYKGRMAMGAAQAVGKVGSSFGSGGAAKAASSVTKTPTDPIPAAATHSTHGRLQMAFASAATDPSSTAASRVKDRVAEQSPAQKSGKGTLVRTGATLVAAAATGGTSAVATAAGKQAGRHAADHLTRRSVLRSKLQPSVLPATSSTGGVAPPRALNPKTSPGGPAAKLAAAATTTPAPSGAHPTRVTVPGQVVTPGTPRQNPTVAPSQRSGTSAPAAPVTRAGAETRSPSTPREAAPGQAVPTGTPRQSPTLPPARRPTTSPATPAPTSAATDPPDAATRRLRAQLEARRARPIALPPAKQRN